MKYYGIDIGMIVRVNDDQNIEDRVKDVINLIKQNFDLVDPNTVELTGGPDEVTEPDES